MCRPLSECSVVRVTKDKAKLPKLQIIPANEVLDEIETRKTVNRTYLTPSPSPSPQPMDDFDPEVDPDNVVIRGSYTDDENDDK